MKTILSKIKTSIKNSIKELTLKRVISYVAVLLFSIFFFWYGTTIEYTTNVGQQELHHAPLEKKYVKVKVIDLVDDVIKYGTDAEGNQTEEIKERIMVYKCKILDGENEGNETYAIQRLTGIGCVTIKELTNGSKIYTVLIPSPEELLKNYDTEYKSQISLLFTSSDYTVDRNPTIITLVLIFVLMLLSFSRIKGFHTLLSLVLALASVFVVYIPAVLSGANIYLWTVIICLYATIESLILLEGLTKKAFVAIIGCISGVAVCGIICYIANNAMNIVGAGDELGSEEGWITNTYWETFNHTKTIDIRGVVFSGVLFGALGAIMDVSMSLASSLLEVYNNSSNHSLANTLKSGFNIGRDMLGTMSNTLVLAYLSTSLSLMLYYVSHYYPDVIMRTEAISLALSQALIGCIGILVTIPLTSVICGLLYNKKEEWFKQKEITE